MKKIDEKDEVCCQDQACGGVESCDCQGICTCLVDINFDESSDDCDNCCCGDDEDEDDDEEDDDL